VVLRQLHRWLHQHIFKVGWLLSKNFQTTTILYYTFFLPGIALHEISYWLMAGILNVRADRAISWPEAQEIGQLNLNFVKLAKNVPSVKLAIITLTPLVAGLLAIWHIANNILNVGGFLTAFSSGQADLGTAFTQLSSAPDFWLWCYIIFTVSNTMIPNVKDLGGLKIILAILAVVIVGLFWIGVGDEVLSQTLNSITNGLSALNGVFAVMIAVNLTATGVLGLAESIIERITGDSATFVKGKLVAMTREEMLNQRAHQAEQERKPRDARARAAALGPPSVYKLPLPIPSAPGKEPVSAGESIIVEREKPPALPSGAVRDDRAGPAVITGAVAADKLPPPSATPGERPATGTQPSAPGQRPAVQSPAAAQPGATGDRPALSAPPGARPSVTSGGPTMGGPRPPDRPGAPAISGPRPPTQPGARPPALTPATVPVEKPEPDEDEGIEDVEDELPEGDVFGDLYDDDEEDEDVEDLA
jgi:hypothetical protein